VWRDALAAMPDIRHDVQEVVVDGDVEMARVVVTGTLHGELRWDQGHRTQLSDRSGGDHSSP